MSSVVQLSPEWFALRAGKLTASNFKSLKAEKTTAAYQNLIWGCAVERMTGEKLDSYCSPAMQRGIDLEADARVAYENHVFATVEEIGIVIHPELDYVSCSPDGLVLDGLVELKCLNAANHGKALVKNQHAKDYKHQCQGQMWVCDKPWCDIVSYHPEFADGLQLAVCRVERDEEIIESLEVACIAANDEINEIIKQLEKMK